MPGLREIFAAMVEADPSSTEKFIEDLESRAALPQQRAMLESYLAEIEFPAGARALDVGCGTGAVTRTLAGWPGVGEAVGVDTSEAFVEKARELAAGLANISFEVGDGGSLPFEEGAFDAVVGHTLLNQVPSPERAVGEAFRVLRPGGWAAFFDGDYPAATVATGAFDPLQACVGATMEAVIQNKWVVRRLPALARAAGFGVTSFRSHGYAETSEPSYMLTVVDRGAEILAAAGRISAETADALKAEARRRADAGEFFGHIAYASLIARKP